MAFTISGQEMEWVLFLQPRSPHGAFFQVELAVLFHECLSKPQYCVMALIPPCTSIPHLSSRWKWKKMAGNRWTWFGVRVIRTVDYPAINLTPHKSAPYIITMHAHARQTDERTSWQ